MLLYITEFLQQYHSGFNVFQYLTLRAILGTITALVLSLIIGPPMIRKLTSYKIGQHVRDDGPQSHLSKAGTPTMGGSLILISIAISTLLWSDLNNHQMWVALSITLLFGLIGGIDDYKKLVYGNSKGLSARVKYFWQTVFGLGAAVLLYHLAETPVQTALILPFLILWVLIKLLPPWESARAEAA